jgi:hypothetical protein
MSLVRSQSEEFMSTFEEELRSLESCKQFMYDLLDPKKTPKVPKYIRQRARTVVKHYPIMISFFVDKYNQHDSNIQTTSVKEQDRESN